MKFLRALVLLIWFAGVLALAVGLVNSGTGMRERRAVRDLLLQARASGQEAGALQLRLSEAEDKILKARLLTAAGGALAAGIPLLGWYRAWRRGRR